MYPEESLDEKVILEFMVSKSDNIEPDALESMSVVFRTQ